jgi:hypothetical protein
MLSITTVLQRRNVRLARNFWGPHLGSVAVEVLKAYSTDFQFSVGAGDLLFLDRRWYVTHTGLLRLSRRRHCSGIQVQVVRGLCDPGAGRYVFRAIVHTSSKCKGFAGYGDADPSNVSSLFHGAEMRVAETRAVNRALRKAYGIGICSVDELGSSRATSGTAREVNKLPAQPANGNGWNGGPKVRDRLCQLIRQHQLDATLVKAYAVDFCGTKSLREATREQVENFVQHLADWAESDRNALLCQLNSYLGSKEGVA